ncbi:hypothetical protein [Halorussus lipolyticus]|uniref:hypothetical protein n=1 Tax=Halorussus lipolyticus TaxID=3034024 RepID=UPI0023E8E9EA|nr:hypothetical protein [Halorussus sp. DT80]
MHRLASVTVLLGAALASVGAVLVVFGPIALLAVGAVLLVIGSAIGFADYLGRDDRYRVSCPDCGTKNWAERATCRDCGASL